MTAREEVSRQDSRERTFASDLDDLLNRYSAENASNTPDFILGEFLRDSLAAFDKAVVRRSAWYGSDDQPGQKIPEAAEAQRPSVAGADGWRCFHCNETFTDRDAALEHFGQNETRAPACTVDIAAFREMEETMARWQSQGGNDDEYAAEIAAIARDNKHRLELQREEERGYAKGLADGRTETAAPRPPAAADIARPWRDDPATFPPAAADEREAWLEQAARVVIEAPTDTTPTEIAQQIRSMKAARPHPVAPAATQDEAICPKCYETWPLSAIGSECGSCPEEVGGIIEANDDRDAASSQLPAGQAVAWQAIGRYASEICRPDAELAPPQYLLDAIGVIATPAVDAIAASRAAGWSDAIEACVDTVRTRDMCWPGPLILEEVISDIRDLKKRALTPPAVESDSDRFDREHPSWPFPGPRDEQATPAVDPAPAQPIAPVERFLTVTTTEAGEAVLVSWQDEEHRILEVVWERAAAPTMAARPVIAEIAAERERQISVEGWAPQHDDEHADRSMAQAARCYVAQYVERAWLCEQGEEGQWSEGSYQADPMPHEWPDSWAEDWWKPKSPRRDLVRAAALIVAEIERLDRALATDGDDRG